MRSVTRFAGPSGSPTESALCSFSGCNAHSVLNRNIACSKSRHSDSSCEEALLAVSQLAAGRFMQTFYGQLTCTCIHLSHQSTELLVLVRAHDSTWGFTHTGLLEQNPKFPSLMSTTFFNLGCSVMPGRA